MTRKEFAQLKVGDICEIKDGINKGRRAEVLFIVDDSILLRPLDGQRMYADLCISRKVRLYHPTHVTLVTD